MLQRLVVRCNATFFWPMLCGVSMSGWTVCYSGDISCDSGMAISGVGRQVGLHISVSTMVVTLSTYLLYLRLLGVLEVDISVSRGCSTVIEEDFAGRFCVFGVCRLGINLSWTVVFSCLVRGNPGLHVIVVAVSLVPVEAVAHCSLCFVCAVR